MNNNATDIVGQLDIEPHLNQSETHYLAALARSRRCPRPGGPYAVPGNEYVAEDLPRERPRRTAAGQPSRWCNWSPTMDGSGLGFTGGKTFSAPLAWLRYLIDHFLQPGALASKSGEPWFDDFTFDHELDGVVAGHHRDTRELFTVRVTRSQITKSVLRQADALDEEYWACLKYDELPPFDRHYQ